MMYKGKREQGSLPPERNSECENEVLPLETKSTPQRWKRRIALDREALTSLSHTFFVVLAYSDIMKTAYNSLFLKIVFFKVK